MRLLWSAFLLRERFFSLVLFQNEVHRNKVRLKQGFCTKAHLRFQSCLRLAGGEMTFKCLLPTSGRIEPYLPKREDRRCLV
jgi:hypothetical protein